jgi:Zn-dependent protease with chaperone function
MRLDTANRAFVALLALALGAYFLVGMGACAILGQLVYRAATDGAGESVTAASDLGAGVLFLLVVGTGAVMGIVSLHRQLAATETLRRRVRAARVAPPTSVTALTERPRLSDRIDVVDAAEPFSFAYGLLRPRVAVSLALLEGASPAEVQAVLEHERYHVRNLDPLKVLLARSLTSGFFYLPALSGLRARYLAGRELAADRRAVDAYGPTPLAQALHRVVRGPRWQELKTAAAIGGPELLDARIAQLESGDEPDVAPVSASAAAVTVLALGALVWSLASSDLGAGMAAMHLAHRVAPMWLQVAGVTSCLALAGLLAYHGLRWLSGLPRRGLDTTLS